MSALPATPELMLRSALTLNRQGEWPAAMPTRQWSAAPLAAEYLQDFHGMFELSFAPAQAPDQVLLTALYPLALRAQLALMLQPDLPFAIPGAIHLSNRLQALAAIDWQAPFVLSVSASRITASHSDAEGVALQVEFAQHGVAVADCRSEYLVRRGRKPLARSAPPQVRTPSQEETWVLTPAVARRYARVSGDYNPIHLHPVLARWFGARSVLAHGMYLAARTESVFARADQRPRSTVAINFVRPVLLPCDDLLFQREAEHFVLRRAGQVLATGSVCAAS
ncbi:MAG TPA: MaoC/PaaZ C-terminal domain-containing protein [Permianibacter sp.]|nr:MaoC/PaaZ C-terminal domain-containing protein [Permianibacter sp.]